jgi:hypothetical protein
VRLLQTASSLSPELAAHLGAPTITRLSFSSGREGVREKLRYLRGLIDEDRHDPYVRALAARILRASGLPPSDAFGRAVALFEWVRANFTYIHEPLETFIRPRRLLLDPRFHFGDCDDFTLAIATLDEAAGYDTSLEAIGWLGHFKHVFHRMRIRRAWYAVEGTLPEPFSFDPAEKAAAIYGRGELGPLASSLAPSRLPGR